MSPIVTRRVGWQELCSALNMDAETAVYGVEFDEEARVLNVTVDDPKAPEGATERVQDSYYADSGHFLGERDGR